MVQKILKSMENSSSEHTRGAGFCLYMVCSAQSGYIWVGAKAREEDSLDDEYQNFISGRFGLVRRGSRLLTKVVLLQEQWILES